MRLRSTANTFVGLQTPPTRRIPRRPRLRRDGLEARGRQNRHQDVWKTATAINAFLNTLGRRRSIHVVALTNNGYFAFDPETPPLQASSEWRRVFLVSKQFNVLRAINAF